MMKKLKNFSFKNFIVENKLKLLFLILPSILIFYFGNYALLITFLSVFSVLENSSFQIFGTFLSSNKENSFYKIFLFIVLIFIAVLFFEWNINNGRLDFGRLTNFDYNPYVGLKALTAPLLLFFLTYKKIPVSTTFVLLSGFMTKHTVDMMLAKTATSYLVSFIFGYYIWYILDKRFKDKITKFDEKDTNFWKNIQILSNIVLIVMWITSNNGNLIVSLPRNFTISSFLLYLSFCAITIAYIILSKGGKMQKSIIDAKKGLNNPKTGSIINMVFSSIILAFQFISTTPIATTWAFIGLLSGREFALSMKKHGSVNKITILKILKDLSVLIYGLIVTFIYIFVIRWV